MKRHNKKGFTIVELVIVVAVIAILSAVLIPTFAGIIKKANASADQQAVRQMNVTLATNECDNIYDVFDALKADGMDAKGYKALSANTTFVWDSVENKILIVENNTTVVYPEEYKNVTYTDGRWSSLSQTLSTKKVTVTDGATTVTDGAELAYALEKAEQGQVKNITISGTVDMMGAALDLDIKKELTISGGTIKNATATNADTTWANVKPGQDGFYHSALFPQVLKGQTLKLTDVTFENVNIKDTNGSNVAILVGHNAGTVDLTNVTIKNSSVIGHHNVATLIGNQEGGLLKVSNVNIQNVKVEAVGGIVGKLIGYANFSSLQTINGAQGAITLTNVTTGVYNCAANNNGSGLVGTSITSDELLADGTTEPDTRYHFNNALVGNFNDADAADADKKGTCYRKPGHANDLKKTVETIAFYNSVVLVTTPANN